MVAEAVAHSGTFISITTNGTLLDEARAERLLETGVHMIDISIDAFRPETYAHIRVKGDLTVTRANVERLIALKHQARQRTRIVVSYIEQPPNVAETALFEHFWRNAGADTVAIRRLHSASGAVIPVADLMRRDVASIARRPCLYPWERVILDPAGLLKFCPSDWTGGSVLADYRQTGIASLWLSEAYEHLRRAHLLNRFDAQPFCGQCPDWQQTRWPADGLSYADLIADLKQTA